MLYIVSHNILFLQFFSDNNQPTIKASDLIDAWDDTSTLGHQVKKNSTKKAKNKTPPNMCANVYADIPAHNPPPPPRRPSQTTMNSSYSGNSSDRLWDEPRHNGTMTNGRPKRSVEFDGFTNGGFDPRPEYTRQGSRESNKYSRQGSRDFGYSRQNSREQDFSANGTFTLPHNYTRQSSSQSNGGGGGMENGFQTMPHPHRAYSKAKTPGPPTYAKPKIPKRTTSLDKLNSNEEVYEKPTDMRGSQASLYGYSTTLPE